MCSHGNMHILNRLFSENFFFNTVQHQSNRVFETIVERFVNDPESKCNGELISSIYKTMDKMYRNEYFYQNTLLNKLLLGIHSVETTTALTQIPIKKSKADFILINGKAVVYEIKTELDNFGRLETQLRDYYTAFNRVCLVTSEGQYAKANELLGKTNVGIYVLTKRNCISKRKEPIQDDSHLNHISIFKVLRKKEYEGVLLDYYSLLPNVTQVSYYEECLKLFSMIPIQEAYEMALKQLKKRNKIKISNFNDVPYELKSVVYFNSPSQYRWNTAMTFLKAGYKKGGRNVFPISQR